ncbi:bifunctional UDP-N-acetylmuramoyl-tripeptide:D-alanyl-D-alanine ligase/alanine racemase [Aquirufa sp. HETE-83D]|uniref:Alanine racemase n=1 Tax=Aquirufa esocilacus TaxID=3096513 RepID=A0ABW6DH82_9BACT
MIQHKNPAHLRASFLSLDSRQIYEPAKTAFFAVNGLHHDGHQYVESLYMKGVREFIVEEAAWHGPIVEKATKWEQTNIYVVESSIATLQVIAEQHRAQFNYPVIGITGSNGKTICKEWLSMICNGSFSVVKSPKSYNSQIGVPLSLWAMQEKHNLGIFEAGISQKGEMEKIEAMLKPDYGIFTHFGEAHGSNFSSDEEKLREKLQLFKRAKKLVYRVTNLQEDPIKQIMQEFNPSCELIGWNTISPDKGLFTFWQTKGKTAQIKVIKAAQSESFIDSIIDFNDDASLENCTHCLIMASILGIERDQLASRARALKPISMRLEMKEGLRGNTLIDDSYNNDLDGLRLALPLLKKNKQKKSVLIVSDFLETGIPEKDLYNTIAALVKHQKIDQLIGIGEQIIRNKANFEQIDVFHSTEDLISSSLLTSINNSQILLKGARKYNFEKLVHALENKTHRTQLEVNLDALQHNLTYFKKDIGPETKLMVMVKAFAYGTGAIEIATLLQNSGVDYLTVAYTDEGVYLRKHGIYVPIMVMNPQIEEFDKLTENGLEPEIYSLELLKAIDEYATQQGKNIKIHIKLDTGMKRLGFEPSEIAKLSENLTQMPHLWVASILSHLAAADSPQHKDFTEKQIQTFNTAASEIETSLGYQTIKHIANSAAIQSYPSARLDMVRLGISLYGITGNPNVKNKIENVLTLKTSISQIKNIAPDETIGYGRRGKLAGSGRIATLAIGYADGYSRALGMGKGSFEIKGHLCPTVGSICMDMCMVDISQFPDISVEDTAIAFGGKIQLYELAKQADTIPYELMTNISERVKRVYVTQ